MDRSLLVITLALTTLLLVMAWAWYTKRQAESEPHYFGEKPDDEAQRTNASQDEHGKAG